MTTPPLPDPTPLPCTRCGADTNPGWHYDQDGERHPTWSCTNLPDCGFKET